MVAVQFRHQLGGIGHGQKQIVLHENVDILVLPKFHFVKRGFEDHFRIVFRIGEAALQFRWPAMLLGAISIVYGGYMAFAQTDFKRLVADENTTRVKLVELAQVPTSPVSPIARRLLMMGLLLGHFMMKEY